MVVIENLSFRSITRLIILISTKRITIGQSPIYFIDTSKFFKRCENYIISKFSNKIKKLSFVYDSLNDENGTNYGFFKIEEDILSILQAITFEKYFDDNFITKSEKKYRVGYLKKCLVIENWPGYGYKKSLRNFLLMIRAINNNIQDKGSKPDMIFFLISSRFWIDELNLFSSKYNISLVPIDHSIIRIKQSIFEYFRHNKYIFLGKIFYDSARMGNVHFWKDKKLEGFNQTPKIMVKNYTQIFKPDEFWSFFPLPNDIVFVSQLHKINQNELNDLKKIGMNFIPLSLNVAKGIKAEYFRPDNAVIFANNFKKHKISKKLFSLEKKIVFQYMDKYNRRKEYWKRLFNDTGIKIYLSFDKWSTDAISASAAIKQIGGISSVVQTSYYEFPTHHSSMFTDIFFSYSSNIKNVELKIGSNIKYIVCTGFVYDYYFKNKKEGAKKIRNQLLENGAKKIISLLDGGSKVDERWNVGITNYQNDYKFWLEKLLEENWLGIIIKSKGPGSFRKRLGNVSELLDKAIATGRCYFSDESNYYDKNLNFRVAQAAFASDIVIHFCLYAGSAGLEAKLTGVPTLMFDRFGLRNSQFYKLGLNKIVFNDWNEMWIIIKEHFTKDHIPVIGDWSPIIDDSDPFQDGKAAYRINTYLNWLLEGFKQGLDRDKIMDKTAERYASEWGEDKIICLS